MHFPSDSYKIQSNKVVAAMYNGILSYYIDS